MKVKSSRALEFSSDEEIGNVKYCNGKVCSSDDEEANADLSLEIIEKAMLRKRQTISRDDGVSEIVTNLKHERKKKDKKKSRKSNGSVVSEAAEAIEIDVGFRDFVGDLFQVETEKHANNVKDEEKPVTDKAKEISDKSIETNPVEVSDNTVLRKLLRGPRYFDPPNNSWGACYNCGEEGHTAVNCTSAKRKKPCFVCGNFEHNAKQCTKGRDCYICKQQGHRAKDCPGKNQSSKICLRCGDEGHDMFLCRNSYSSDDLKNIQCYVCQRFGHLCCVKCSDPGPREVSCYRCGLSGHTGLACTGYRTDINDPGSAHSCYKCGVEGHFARECTSSTKSTKRNHEPSTPKVRSYKKKKDQTEVKSAPHDFGNMHKKQRIRYGEPSPPAEVKHRGGWTTEHPGDFHSTKSKPNHWRSPVTPNNRGSKISSWNGSYSSSSRTPKRHSNFHTDSTSNGFDHYYPNRFSTSRYGNSSNDWSGRSYNRW
ncbi:uncharacterized protein [Henckelia pumila]|uniref:uncharacterized protein n=1 Tax=Henckelia pumila TaxID=405737 RepID=UPI003C6DCEF7